MKIGIADTMFARADMAQFCIDIIKDQAEIERYTVPGVKDLPIACQKLFEEYHCDIVIALGNVGAENVDKTCGHEASTAIQNVMLKYNKHILEVFVHLDESNDDKTLYEVMKNRAEKHTKNALALLKGKTELTKFAGQGIRQGFPDEGPLQVNK